MTDPLACVEAAIDTLGSRKTRFWTPLDTSEGQVSTPNPKQNCGFGHFGQSGHRIGDTLRDDRFDVHESASRGDVCTPNGSRASSPISRGVQSVQSVQTHQINEQDQRLGFGHLEAAGVQNPGSGVQSRQPHPLDPDLARLEGIPLDWIEGVRLLREVPRPRTWPGRAWQQLLIDAERFLQRWGAQAACLGWQNWELFGCCRAAPWNRIQGLGLALLLGDREVVALTDREAAIRTPRGERQTYHRKPVDPLHPAERCLVWELAR